MQPCVFPAAAAFFVRFNGKASVFLAMIPVVTALLGFFMGREKLCPIQWTGVGVAFAGLILTQYVLKRNRGQKD